MLEWMTQWQCPRCAYVQKSLRKCGMCEEPRPKDATVSPLIKRPISISSSASPFDWLERNGAAAEHFKKTTSASLLGAGSNKKTSAYFSIPSSTHANLRSVTTELHSMFVRATEHVLRTPSLWSLFDLPDTFWNKAPPTFKHTTLTGCFDLAVNPDGIKCLKYNADGANGLFESGYVQAAWSNALGLGDTGVDSGIGLEARLIDAWRQVVPAQGSLVHFFFDANDEERCQAYYMMECAKQAGVECHGVEGKELTGFSFNEKGGVLDEQKREVKRAWKTWRYDALFAMAPPQGKVGLLDVFLNSEAVWEPLWTAITASKALLPIVSDLYPLHANLLHSAFKPSASMQKRGYARVPIKGGEAIVIYRDQKHEAKAEKDVIYQELSSLPKFDDLPVRVQTFTVLGLYAGTLLRVGEGSLAVSRVQDDQSGAVLPSAQVGREKQLRTGQPAPFGAVMGLAPGGIPAYSCDYDLADERVYPNRRAYRHEVGNLYYGFRFQCVEFARRWLIHAQGITFGDVGMAYEIFDMKAATDVRTKAKVPWSNVRNGGREKPQAGAVIIWSDGGEFRWTGHVAIITEVTDSYVRIAEQNVDDAYWPPGRDWARELSVRADKGGYHIHEPRGAVLGWKNVPKDFQPNPLPMTIDSYETGAMKDFEDYHK